MSQGDPPPVFTYEDYRAYLRDVYAHRKGRGLSHRGLARRAKLGSPSFLKAVMDGQKNLARATAARVASALGLAGDAAEYFSLLVVANQTTDAAERRSFRARLGRLRRYQDVRALSDARDAYHRHWYLPAIRELASTNGFRADPRWIARVLRPSISMRQAKEALSTLADLGLLRADESGVLCAVDREVTTELEPNSEQIAEYHRSMILGALRAVADVPRPERDISSITLSVDATGFAAMKRRMQEIRRELLDEFDAGKSGVQVVQVNFQLFPLSRRIDDEDASR
ncbi:MAG TPA: TIGR02147 family protein [Polyangiaceae bacterium]|nr:TIGR02147 family protein [Polyangiaceae bacterium]